MTMPQEKYWSTLCNRFGSGWTRFWFTPSDPIVLCLLRFMVGLVALWWFLGLLPVVQEWYGPQGMFPLSLAQELRKDAAGDLTFAIPVLDWIESPSQLWLAYYLGLASIVLMIAGVLSRITTIAALLFVLSFIHRGVMLARPVDDILAMLMFYLCLGPTGAELSVDALIRKRRQQSLANTSGVTESIRYSSAATVATRLMQVHLALVYGAMFIGRASRRSLVARHRGVVDHGPARFAADRSHGRQQCRQPCIRIPDQLRHPHHFVIRTGLRAINLESTGAADPTWDERRFLGRHGRHERLGQLLRTDAICEPCLRCSANHPQLDGPKSGNRRDSGASVK